MTWAELIRDAFLEIAVIDPLDDVPPQLQALGLVRLNGIINQRNAQQISVYAILFPTYTTTSGLSPHTIGPSTATWSATSRPVDIVGINQQTGSGVNLINYGPLKKRDRAWWLWQTTQQLQAGVATDFYYEPTWPNGSVYLWPVPNAAVSMQLEIRIVLDEIAEADLGTDVSLPPGYQRDFTLSLAEDLVGPMTAVMPDGLPDKARMARAIVENNNNPPIRIVTRQSGMPNDRGRDTGFNWVTGKGAGR